MGLDSHCEALAWGGISCRIAILFGPMDELCQIKGSHDSQWRDGEVGGRGINEASLFYHPEGRSSRGATRSQVSLLCRKRWQGKLSPRKLGALAGWAGVRGGSGVSGRWLPRHCWLRSWFCIVAGLQRSREGPHWAVARPGRARRAQAAETELPEFQGGHTAGTLV